MPLNVSKRQFKSPHGIFLHDSTRSTLFSVSFSPRLFNGYFGKPGNLQRFIVDSLLSVSWRGAIAHHRWPDKGLL
jgi:hypothetical protein